MAGDLSIGGDVVTTSNATLDLAPNGTGTVVVRGNNNSGAVVFNCESNSHGQKVYGQPHSAGVTNTLMLPAGANSTLVSLVSTDTLTNKTLTSPKVNEDVVVTSTATELNLLDGVTATTAELNILDGVTATAAEINLIDGGTSRGTTAVADGDGFLTNDGGTMRMTKVDTLATYMQNKIIGGTSIVTTGALDSGSITSGFGTINTGASAITTTGAITGGSFVIGSADINENDLESIDGITAGTIAASKAAVVDANKDVTGFRNVTLTGELDAGSLDISGDADIDGTLETDALSINGTAVTSTAAELNILDGVTSTAAELNILDGVTSTAAELNILDGVTSTAAELNALDGITAVVGELNALDIGSTAVGTAVASKAVILDSNKDYTGVRNFTLSGELDTGSLDVSGNADIDGTLETDNLTVGGAQGSDGQVLTSTGSGVAWEDAAGGASALVASAILTSAASSITVTGFSTSYDTYRVNALLLTADGGTEYLNIRWTQDDGTEYASGFYGWRKMQMNSTSHIRADPADDNAMFLGDQLAVSQTEEAGSDFHLTVTHPKNDLAATNLSGFYNEAPTNNGTTFLRGKVADKDLDVGGIKFFFASGDNLAVGSYVRIYGVNKS
jgi:cytoskeletal protein CcmA (bactofilin family)